MRYATLYQIREYLGYAASETSDDGRLTRLAGQTQADIDLFARRTFAPLIATRYFDFPIKRRGGLLGLFDPELFVAQWSAVGDLNAGRLRLDADLLTATLVVNGDGTTVAATDYVTGPPNLYPKSEIVLKTGSGLSWLPGADGDREQVIAVTGQWGYHVNPSAMWVDTLDTLKAGVNAAATTISVNDADGTPADLDPVRFQAGNLIQIGTEWLDVIAVDTTLNTLTVLRGAQGSTAAAHDLGDKVYVFRPDANVVLAHIRLTVWRYRQKDVDSFDKASILANGVVTIPASFPEDVAALIPMYQRLDE